MSKFSPMNTQKIVPFRDVLSNIHTQPSTAWVYLPKNKSWDADCDCIVLESEEVPPELEDSPDAGIPEFAKAHNLMQTLPVSVLQDIVQNAKAQEPDVSEALLFKAFLYYYDNDAFIVFETKQ